MTIKPRFIEIKPPDFAMYIGHGGLERIVAEREKSGETDRAGREQYSRYAKVIVRAGAGPGDHVTRPVGVKAELVPLSDPSGLRVGQSLTLRLLTDGTCIRSARRRRLRDVEGRSGRLAAEGGTNKNGEVTFALEHGGGWLFRSVHRVRASDPGSPAADWES